MNQYFKVKYVVFACAEAASACCSCCCSCFWRSWTWCSAEQEASAPGAEAPRVGELSRRGGSLHTWTGDRKHGQLKKTSVFFSLVEPWCSPPPPPSYDICTFNSYNNVSKFFHLMCHDDLVHSIAGYIFYTLSFKMLENLNSLLKNPLKKGRKRKCFINFS